eukprot:g26451.t1
MSPPARAPATATSIRQSKNRRGLRDTVTSAGVATAVIIFVRVTKFAMIQFPESDAGVLTTMDSSSYCDDIDHRPLGVYYSSMIQYRLRSH